MVATRSGPYPAQMITAVNRSSLFPDQIVDQHLETTSTALNISGDQDTLMSPRDRSPVRTLSPRHLSGKYHWKQWSPYNLTLLQLELNYWFVWPGGELVPQLSLVSPNVFFSVLSPMEFWFLTVVASGLLSCGHFISSDITDLISNPIEYSIEFNNEMPLTEKWHLILSFYIIDTLLILFSYFDIVQLL